MNTFCEIRLWTEERLFLGRQENACVLGSAFSWDDRRVIGGEAELLLIRKTVTRRLVCKQGVG